MGTDNYTKEEREFYESIMQEIRSHQDFGKRNPVDIGIECGYSEDDVMGMIYMCQDIVGEKQTQQEPIPKRENWELEGIIPFEDFVEINFPSSYKSHNYDIDSKWSRTCSDIGIISPIGIGMALDYAEKMKQSSLEELGVSRKGVYEFKVKSGFKDMVQWMSMYSIVAAKIFEGKEIPMAPFLEKEIKAIESLIKLEIETGEFAPLDKIVIDANGWDISKVTNIEAQANEQTEQKQSIADSVSKIWDMTKSISDSISKLSRLY